VPLQRRLMILAAVGLLSAACKKKFEILPDEAKQVSRSDKTETGEEGQGDISLREYKFSLKEQTFLCESRNYPDSATALAAAKKNIAERPQEELKSEKAQFALSGRSVWLRADKQLVWCMLSSGKGENVAMAMQPVRNLFVQKYKEASP
jgi:hypothetical protein